MNNTQRWLQFFEQSSCFFRERYMLPRWRKYSNYITDIWDSLAIFLGGYAFERQGRRPDYSPTAVDTLFYCKKRNNGNMRENVVYDIWQHFAQLLNNQGLNPRMNPLYPQQSPHQKPSIIQLVLDNGIVQRNLTYATYFQNQINQGNDIQNAFDLLKSVRGIGDKIASLYLRDLVDVMNIPLDNIQNRYLLQPIDIWVERTVKILTNNQEMNRNQIANWIVSASIKHDINPEQVNMGMWFFASNLALSEYKLRDALKNLNSAQDLVNDFKTRIRNIYRHC